MSALARFADPARSELTVVSVAPPELPLLFPVTGAAYISDEAYKHNDEMNRRIRNRAQRHAESAGTRLRDEGFDVEVRVASGDPIEQLLKEAESGRFDLVAVGSRGLGPFRRVLLGSVSDQVVRHSRAALIGRRLEA